MSINRAILLGHVGGDPDIRTTNGGDMVAIFSLATSETWKDKPTGERREATEWHRVVVFNQQIAAVARDYVKKGARVSVEGMIKTREYTDRDGGKRKTTEIVIGRFDGRLSLEGQPQGGAARDEHGYGTQRTREPPRNPDDPRDNPPPTRAPIDDDIPF